MQVTIFSPQEFNKLEKEWTLDIKNTNPAKFAKELEEKLELKKQLEQKINKLNERIEKCEISCKKLDEHIDFVENTYETLKGPLDYVKDKFNYLRWGDSGLLMSMGDK